MACPWEQGFAAVYRLGIAEAGLHGGPLESSPAVRARQVSKPKRVGKKDPKMARALKKANAMGRKKNGGLKKGWSQGKIMKKAHALKKRMR